MNGYDALVDAVVAGDFVPLGRRMTDERLPAPTLAWNPPPEELPEPQLRVLAAYWNGRRAALDGLPHVDSLDPLQFKEALGYVMLLDKEGDGSLRYRLYGSRIAERSGFDLTGRTTREVQTHPAIGLFFEVCYRAVALRGEPLFTRHVPPSVIGVTHWSRIVLPVADAAGAARHFLVGNVPGERRPVDAT
jgi:hypothetical protein